jgi:RNA polymerase sigma-70 factor (ECF subfamily)
MESRHMRLTVIPGGRDAREREFERLYRESYSAVYGWVRARMGSDEDAEDVVSEAYLLAARSFDSYDPSRAKFGTWVTTIARNCMISHYRKQRPSTALDDVPEALCAVSGEQDHVDDRLLVKAVLACLDDEERELVALKYREGMRNVDIAATVGMNPSTVATKLARALQKIRQTMGISSSE